MGEEPAKVGWTHRKNGLTKRADALGVEGRRRRPRLRWEDCVKRELVGSSAWEGNGE